MLHPDTGTQAILEYLCSESNKVYNSALYYARQLYFKTKRFAGRAAICSEMAKSKNRHFGAIYVSAAQQTCNAVAEALKSYIQVGGELTDHFAKGSALFTFLKELGSGADLDVAIQAGKNEATLIFKSWNKNREWQVHRNPASLDDYMDGVKRRFLAIANQSGNPGKENAA